jgi:hypothetical protein
MDNITFAEKDMTRERDAIDVKIAAETRESLEIKLMPGLVSP